MSLVRRCLLHAPGSARFLDLARELVALGAEVVAVGDTAARLERSGIPVDRPAAGRVGGESHQLLQPRVMQGVLGDWTLPEERAALEMQGVKRIDMVVAELPAEAEEPDSGWAPHALEALTVLRAAAWVPQRVLVLCDPADTGAVLGGLGAGDLEAFDRLRWRLAGKALLAISRLDAARAGRTAAAGGLPTAWSLQLDVLGSLPLQGERSGAAGLYDVSRGRGGAPALQLLCGEALSPAVLQAASLAWSAVEACRRPAVALAHRMGLVGFASPREESLAQAFDLARSLDPRGAFGAVAAFNREVGDAAGRGVADAVLEAVIAPAFSAEVQALSRRRRLRLVQVQESPKPSLQVTGTRWGLVVEWRALAGGDEVCRTLSAREVSAPEEEALELAWRLLRALTPGAAVVCDGERMLGAAGAQASAREAARLALSKAGSSARGAVMALSRPMRLADDVQPLGEAGVTAVRQPEGSPRLEEILSRAASLGLAVQVVAGRDPQSASRGEA